MPYALPVMRASFLLRSTRADAPLAEKASANGRARFGTSRLDHCILLNFMFCTTIHIRLLRSPVRTCARANAKPLGTRSSGRTRGTRRISNTPFTRRSLRCRSIPCNTSCSAPNAFANAFAEPIALLAGCWCLFSGCGRRQSHRCLLLNHMPDRGNTMRDIDRKLPTHKENTTQP